MKARLGYVAPGVILVAVAIGLWVRGDSVPHVLATVLAVMVALLLNAIFTLYRQLERAHEEDIVDLSRRVEEIERRPKIHFRHVRHAAAPSRAHGEDAGWDLEALVPKVVPVGAIRVVPTGVYVDLPPGTYGMICSRSSLAAKHGLIVANAPGIIDSGYTGEILVTLVNLGGAPYNIAAGDRIAQIVFGRTDLVTVVGGDTLESDERGDGGHGSSGR